MIMRGFYLAVTLLASLAPQSQPTTKPTSVPAFTIAIDQPVYAGQPIWIRAADGPRGSIRYPFHADAGDIGCNRLEVRHNGALLEQLPLRGTADLSGLLYGSAAPQDSPLYRLPL